MALKGARRGVAIALSVIYCGAGWALQHEFNFRSIEHSFFIRLVALFGATLLAVLDAVEVLTHFANSTAKLEYKRREELREHWELDNFPEGECKEMIELYHEKGIAHRDAATIIRAMAKYPNFFVKHMLVQELGFLPALPDASPKNQAIALGLASIVSGMFTLLPFLLLRFITAKPDFWMSLTLSSLIGSILMFVIGVCNGNIYQWRKSWIVTGTFMVLKTGVICTSCLSISFLISSIV